jgi:peroxiredoxin
MVDTNTMIRWKRWGSYSLAGATALVFGWIGANLRAQTAAEDAPQAPEPVKIAKWINSDGFTLASQRGKVVVLHFWTFGCINCQHNLPYYNKWRKEFSEKDVEIIGIHTPETDGEANIDNVVAQVPKLEITYPVAVDNERATWKAYENRCWPTVYVIDREGRVRYHWEGELEYQNAGGDTKVRSVIKQLVSEGNKR